MKERIATMDWEIYARNYLAEFGTPYHDNRLAMVERLLSTQELASVVDFGCGDGGFVRRARNGLGIDISEEMIIQARLGVEQSGSPGTVQFQVGGVEVLRELDASSVDLVMAINSLAYLTSDECEIFYSQANRILRNQGSLVVTHSNELFDMFTFNRYTQHFFKENFSCDVTELLSFPNEPQRKMHSIRANPLAFAVKMREFGFEEVQQEFAIPHTAPPLVIPDFDPDALADRFVSSELDLPAEERWKSMFRCSIFGSRLTNFRNC